MSTALMTVAIGLTRWWVRLYTKGLPPHLRETRRAEIESDLWEQGADASANGFGVEETGLQMVARLLTGIPADLSWRIDQARAGKRTAITSKGVLEGSRSMSAWLAQKGLLGLTVLLAALYIAGGLGFGVGYVTGSLDWDPEAWEVVVFGVVPFVAAVMVLAGLFTTKRSPWWGAGLVAAGTVAVTALWFWLFFILVPLAIVVIGFAVFRARRFAAERDRMAAT